MKITIGKELFKESIYVGLSCGEVVSAFEGVTCVYEGSQSGGDAVSFCLCRDNAHIGMLTVSNDHAQALVATFKEHGVYSDVSPFELSGAS
ncbi:MAG: hypothetical protein ACI86X_000684 [Moritella sp.]|jgi:hypothetical protein